MYTKIVLVTSVDTTAKSPVAVIVHLNACTLACLHFFFYSPPARLSAVFLSTVLYKVAKKTYFALRISFTRDSVVMKADELGGVCYIAV